jgi:hypothetical protein
MLSWASPCGVVPVRSAETNSAREASSPLKRSSFGGMRIGTEAVIVLPGPGSTCGTAWSPSQIAVPCSPTARQVPVHEVWKPSAAQLPVKAKRRPPLIRKTACADAGPSYQE